jgi:predicted alpha/beta hydrolase
LPAGVAQEWARWIRAEDYLFSCVPEAAARAASIKVPMLSLAFSDDTYAPSVAVDRLLDKFSAANPARRLITPQAVNRRRIDHFGFFREGSREELWPEALSFLSGNGQA